VDAIENAGTTLVLHPGDVACATRGDRLQTLLGSCVAVILTDPARTTGAMCHIVYASGRGAAEPTRGAHTVDEAFESMFRMLRARGLNPAMCEAYVYGGGNMFPELLTQPHTGERNVARVLQTLAASAIRVLRQDVGGTSYRRLRWTVGPGLPEVTPGNALKSGD
jgi:chemotaxis protein CheD